MDIRNISLAEVQKAVTDDPQLPTSIMKHDNDEDGITMLWQACSVGAVDIAAFLLTCPNVDVNFRRQKGLASAMYIAAQNNHPRCIELLLKFGADPNLPRDTLATPLFIASQNNNIACIRLLLKYGAKVDSENSQNCTPYVLACSMGHTEAAMLLLTYGADPSNKNTGMTGLAWSRTEKHWVTYEILIKKVFLRALQTRVAFDAWRLATVGYRMCHIKVLEETGREGIILAEDKTFEEIIKDFMQERDRIRDITGESALKALDVLAQFEVDIDPLVIPPTASSSSTVLTVSVDRGGSPTTVADDSSLLFRNLDHFLKAHDPVSVAVAKSLEREKEVEQPPVPQRDRRRSTSSTGEIPASLRYWHLSCYEKYRDCSNSTFVEPKKAKMPFYTVPCNKDYFREGPPKLYHNLRGTKYFSQLPIHRSVLMDDLIAHAAPCDEGEKLLAYSQQELSLYKYTNMVLPSSTSPQRVKTTSEALPLSWLLHDNLDALTVASRYGDNKVSLPSNQLKYYDGTLLQQRCTPPTLRSPPLYPDERARQRRNGNRTNNNSLMMSMMSSISKHSTSDSDAPLFSQPLSGATHHIRTVDVNQKENNKTTFNSTKKLREAYRSLRSVVRSPVTRTGGVDPMTTSINTNINTKENYLVNKSSQNVAYKPPWLI